MESVYLGLGTNLGDKEKNLKEAVELISNFPKTELIKVSKVYETEPWGYTEQDKFLNLCLEVKTELAPYQLLAECQGVEKDLDRERKIRWGPRSIDVDILLYGDLALSDQKLTVPHPRIQERVFVLKPLAELDKKLVIKGRSLLEWIELLDEQGIKEYGELG
ncbi:2-amino-4-hydroxy-6-hydroxymethyldihydropteridine diphosphokinase [Natroniella sp. ANB-PHB2]|uniref:2-amino-4-hydroxy-6- hydroxymethyldihydropteridine diphosphokinase n=1 Tax=Natroniella sp. ANB-PHB2 TaxID=3384444 RepID=UPI0038D410B0